MQKLTKEQAEWLLGRLKRDIYENNNSKIACGRPSEKMKAFKDILNECTEKQFPTFEVDLGAPWSIRVEGQNEVIFFNTLKHGQTVQSSVTFTHEEFQTFISGCVNIGKYLDEIYA